MIEPLFSCDFVLPGGNWPATGLVTGVIVADKSQTNFFQYPAAGQVPFPGCSPDFFCLQSPKSKCQTTAGAFTGETSPPMFRVDPEGQGPGSLRVQPAQGHLSDESFASPSGDDPGITPAVLPIFLKPVQPRCYRPPGREFFEGKPFGELGRLDPLKDDPSIVQVGVP